MILYFLRHGLAADRETWEEADAKRPLTDQGKAQMKRTACTLAELHLKLDVILTSPLVRAVQTAEIAAGGLKIEEKVVKEQRLAPGFNLNKLAEIVADYGQAEGLMLVGHEPDFSLTLSALTGGARLVCKKGGLARVDLDERAADELSGELVWLIPPKVLAR